MELWLDSGVGRQYIRLSSGGCGCKEPLADTDEAGDLEKGLGWWTKKGRSHLVKTNAEDDIHL